MRPLLFFIPATLLVPTLSAQITFERTYGGPEADLGFQVQQTSDGGYALFGVTWNNTAGSSDMLLIRTDAAGSELWSRTYGGVNQDMGYGGRQTSDGGYVLCGMFGGFGTDSLTLIRTDALGNMLWTGHYPGAIGRDIGYAVQETATGGFTVCGFAQGTGVAEDALLLHVNGAGVMQWMRTYDRGDSEVAWNLVMTADGGYALVVNSFVVGDPDGDPVLMRCNAQGDTLWTRRYVFPGPDETHGLDITADGGFILAGGNGYPDRDLTLLRTDAQGTELWRQQWVTAGDVMANGVKAMDDGGTIGTGRSPGSQPGEIALYLFRTDATGAPLWERTVERGIAAEGLGLDRTTDGGMVAVGRTSDLVNGLASTDVLLVKTDAAGYTSVELTTAQEGRATLAPNPCSDRSILQLPRGIWRVRLFGPDGRVLADLDRVKDRTELEVVDLSPGTYLVSAEAADRVEQLRLVVAR